MIDIQEETLIVLSAISFLAGTLITLSVVLAIKLKSISKRMADLANKMKENSRNK